jgi:hypothetical protein
MKTLLFWIGLAILGFLLYIAPGYLVHRMYEDFEVPKQAPVKQTAATQLKLTPSAPPKPTPPSQNQIQNLQRLLDTPVLESSTAALSARQAPVQSDGGRQQPAEYEKIRSAPSHPAIITTPNVSLRDGQAFLASMPSEISPASRGSFGLYSPQRMQGTTQQAPAQVEFSRQIQQVPGYNPNCPDMRDYIRKDSIPCWGCKLR